MSKQKSRAALKSEFRGHLNRFRDELIKKLLRNEQRYQFGNGWKRPNWEQKLQSDLPHHVAKGDARDVGILSFVAWYHGWSTATASRWVATSHSYPTPHVGTSREYWVVINSSVYPLEYAYNLAMEHEGETYTGWMERERHALNDSTLRVYSGPKPTHWMERESAPLPPSDVDAPLYHLGMLAMVEVDGENGPAGRYPATIIHREHGGPFRFLYRVAFTPQYAPEQEAKMGYSYPEARIARITDEEMEQLFPMDKPTAPIDCPPTRFVDVADAIATLAGVALFSEGEVAWMKVRNHKDEPLGVFPVRIKKAFSTYLGPYYQVAPRYSGNLGEQAVPDEVATIMAFDVPESALIKREARSEPEYERGELVWVRNLYNHKDDINPGTVEAVEFNGERWLYRVYPANDRISDGARSHMSHKLWGEALIKWDAPGNPAAPEFDEPSKAEAILLEPGNEMQEPNYANPKDWMIFGSR